MADFLHRYVVPPLATAGDAVVFSVRAVRDAAGAMAQE